MKISVISTVLNERENISHLLDSIASQTLPPYEFIIVDAGSRDGTQQIIKEYARKYRWIKLIVKEGVSIGRGRNIAIKSAKGEIIASIDAGCVADSRWLEAIAWKIKKGCDVVHGPTKPWIKYRFGKYIGYVLCTRLDLPAGRNIAFKRECWEKVNGFPDENVAEDTMFSLKLKEAGFKICYSGRAVVYWEIRPVHRFVKQMFRYGAAEKRKRLAHKYGPWIPILLGYFFALFTSPIVDLRITISLLFLAFLYLLFSGIKAAVDLHDPFAIFFVPFALLLKRISHLAGFLFG